MVFTRVYKLGASTKNKGGIIMAEQSGVGMTPWEFSQYLQEQHFKGKAPDVAADVCDLLLANLVAALSPDQRKLVEDIPVIVLPTRDPNAVCFSCPSGGSGKHAGCKQVSCTSCIGYSRLYNGGHQKPMKSTEAPNACVGSPTDLE